MGVVRHANELFISGRLEEAFGLWSDDAVGIPPADWPERGPWRGPEELRRAFESWDAAFGANWTEHLSVSALIELDDGRQLSEYVFKASGTESGIPVDEQLAGIYTVRDGRMVRGEFFMSHTDARAAVGIE
jgi:ketosteroid isomerase-like protein